MQEKIQLEISGMTCSACANRIEKVLQKSDGVDSVVVNYAMETATVVFDDEKVDLQKLIHRIKNIGYEATIEKGEQAPSNWRLLASILLSLPLVWTMIAHMGLSDTLYVPGILMNPWIQLLLAAPVQFWIGYPFIISAWKSIVTRVLNMDVLVVMGTMIAFGYSIYTSFVWQTSPHRTHMHPDLYFETSSVLITFILLGKTLEHRAKGRASKAIQSLLQLQVKKAIVFENGMEREVNISDVQIGNLIRVKPGDKIPVDGVIVEGEIYVDESMLTGESMPVRKIVGQEVFSGTLNSMQGCLIRAERVGQETVVAQIARTVAEAQASKAPIQRYADRISSIFVPIVIALALMTLLLCIFILGTSQVHIAIERAVAVLVVACPCALGLATPTSILAGTGRAAELGVFFRSGALLERADRTTVVMFDKTGTLTIGKPQLVFTSLTNEQLSVIQSLERLSEHPISRAIVESGGEPGHKQVSGFTAVPGFGIQGIVDSIDVHVGNRKWMYHNQISEVEQFESIASKYESDGATVVFCSIQNRCVGVIAVADQLRPEAIQVINDLRKNGIQVYMLTGDHSQVAARMANQLQIDNVYAELNPKDKLQIINDVKEKGEVVLMVGDGINDSPALAAADIGVAIGSGTSIAIETAGITIRNDGISNLLSLLKISKLTMLNIKQNLVWALVYNLISIPFAMFGLLKPWMAGAAMTFSSISVVLNALRLQKMKK
jgi:Cu+-exporting ATPase